jgi:dTDP-4-dehydrorhamnose reductase
VIRVLITGSRGQVGVETQRELAGRAEIFAYDLDTLDITDAGSIAGVVRDVRPDVIVNCAAYTAVDRAETDVEAARAVNGAAPGLLGAEAHRTGALLIHFSTDYVFDGTKSTPYREDDTPNPASVYGATKLEGERAVAAAGCPHLVLRTSWIYGPHGGNFLFTMVRLARTRPELRIVDDQHGAPTSSPALARLVRGILERGGGPGPLTRAQVDEVARSSGLYHATAAGSTTWFGFARAIFEELTRKGRIDFTVPPLVPIPSADYPTPARRPANSVLSNEKLRAAFGLSIPDWRRGLEDVVSALPHQG